VRRYMMRKISYLMAINEALSEEMMRDKNVVLFGEDVGIFGGCFGVTQGLFNKFGPGRVKDTPISETAIIGLAVGSAATGIRPVAELMFMDFAGVAMDEILNQAAKMRYMFGGKAKLPLVIRMPYGAGISAAAQHSQSLEAWFTHIPGLKVVMPSTPYDVKGLLKSSIRDDNPVIFLEHKVLYGINGDVPEDEYLIPLGKGDVKKEGKDVTVIATGMMVHKALEAASKLEEEGISIEVVDPRALVPLDEEIILNSVKKTGRVVIAHEAPKRSGFGAEIAAIVVEKGFPYLKKEIVRVCGKDTPVPFSPPLEQYYIPQTQDIVQGIKFVMS
jgi:pyruvate dehydrogenase E1 component beta subunit